MSFVSNGNLCIDCTQLDICVCVCVCVYVIHNMEKLVGAKKIKHMGTTVNAACQGKLSACYLDTHVFGSKDMLQYSVTVFRSLIW